jgi:hypothetical protein
VQHFVLILFKTNYLRFTFVTKLLDCKCLYDFPHILLLCCTFSMRHIQLFIEFLFLFIKEKFLIKYISDSCPYCVYTLWVVALDLEIHIFRGYMIGCTDFIKPYSCFVLKKFFFVVLVVVRLPLSVSVNYFHIVYSMQQCSNWFSNKINTSLELNQKAV